MVYQKYSVVNEVGTVMVGMVIDGKVIVGLGKLLVTPGAVTAVWALMELLRVASWLSASAVLLAYTDTIVVVEIYCV